MDCELGNQRQMIGGVKSALRKLFKVDILIMNDMVQACQWKKRRPTLGACFGVLRLLGRQSEQRLEEMLMRCCIKIARRNDGLRFSAQDGG
jgi:hypothetical protein